MPSNVIRSFDYDAASQQLSIVFQSGRTYIYKEVPQATYQALKASASKGEFFNTCIREQFSFTRGVVPKPK
ncbi:MAG TPA: KTSC domain-containing protein [Steroidobacteraceae bacterium]|jgi:lysyl-tRNA synthetase class 2